MPPRARIGSTVDVDVPGHLGPVHVREDGPRDGPVLVLLHGFSGSMHWFDPLTPLLADTFRVVRLDLLGHGSTGGRAADAPVQAGLVGAVLAGLGITGATVVGHSFGADVAVELAERCARVERLVVLAQAPDYSDATLPRAGALVGVPLLGAAIPRVGRLLARAVRAGTDARAATAVRSGSQVRAGSAVGRSPAGPVGLAAQGLADFIALDGRMLRIVLIDRRDRMAARPLDAQVRAAGKPTLVILGGRDHFYGARSERRYLDAGAEVRVLATSGHSPHVELPAETADLIRGFATAQPRQAAP